MIVPLLTFFGVMSCLKSRIATSLYMLLPPIGVFAAYSLYRQGFGDIKAALYMAFLFTITSYFSSAYAMNVDAEFLKHIFGIFTIFAGLMMLLS